MAVTRINKAIFGDTIDWRIHNKLRARQMLSENAIQPNSSVHVIEEAGFRRGPDGQLPTLEEAIGTSNFKRGGMYLADLSSRKDKKKYQDFKFFPKIDITRIKNNLRYNR